MRDALMAALVARLNRCFNSGDCSALLSQETLNDTDALVEAIENSADDIKAQMIVSQVLWLRYEYGKPQSPEAAERDKRRAVAHFSAVHAQFPDGLPEEARNDLDELENRERGASDLIDRGPYVGGGAALSEAIDILRATSQQRLDEDPLLPLTLTELAVALEHRFQLNRDRTDLTEARDRLEKAIALSGPSDPELLNRRSIQKLFLVTLYDISADRTYLDDAIDIGHAVLEAAHDHPHRANMNGDMLGLYKRLYDHTADIRALDTAIRFGRAAIELPNPDIEAHSGTLDDLGIALRRRGERTGDASSVSEAVELHRKAVADFPKGHIDRLGIRNNLAQALRVLGELTADETALREAVQVQDSVVREAGPRAHPALPGFQQNLGVCLRSLYRESGEVSALRAAVSPLRESVAGFASQEQDASEAGAVNPLMIDALSDLGIMLHELALGADTPSDLDEAIDIHRQAVASLGIDVAASAQLRINLASALRTRYERTQSEPDRREAIELLHPVAENAATPPSQRLKAARSWGQLEAEAANWQPANEALGLAVKLLPRVAARNLGRSDQERHLKREPGLVSNAVAAALQVGDVERAAVLFEQGRGVLAAHALDLRADLGELDADLAAEFEHVRDVLDAATNPDQRHHGLSQWDELLARIRQRVPDFLMPMTAEAISASAANGPIVMVNVSTYRCDAIVVTPQSIHAINLPEVTLSSVETNALGFLIALDIVQAGELPRDERTAAGARMRKGLQWLWDALVEPVLSHLDLIVDRPANTPLPRLWWSPSSLLTFLPLHAAGTPDGATSALDYVVSSYTPTLRALQRARSAARSGEPTRGPLVVAMPHTPGERDLPGAAIEAELIVNEFPDTVALIGDDATKERILNQLPAHRWVHFSCHALSSRDDPSTSHLLIAARQQLSILDITKAQLDGEFAFLAACSTGRGGLALIDEAVHLASAFQLAGYPHVIASLWPIYDEIAFPIAHDVYGMIRPGSRTLASSAAILSKAVRDVRSRHPEAPWAWASYMHVGP